MTKRLNSHAKDLGCPPQASDGPGDTSAGPAMKSALNDNSSRSEKQREAKAQRIAAAIARASAPPSKSKKRRLRRKRLLARKIGDETRS
jgi:hypothetical protein